MESVGSAERIESGERSAWKTESGRRMENGERLAHGKRRARRNISDMRRAQTMRTLGERIENIREARRAHRKQTGRCGFAAAKHVQAQCTIFERIAKRMQKEIFI